MRIIAGSARGRRLFSVPKAMMVRPISGRIKQSLFDILRPYVTGSYFLDLFAGTGAVGLEALSRGAQKVCFVERDPRCVAVIEKNLVHFGWAEQCRVLRGDVLGALSWIGHRSGITAFDVAFLGPPYRDEENRPLTYAHRTLLNLAGAGMLSAAAVVVVQHHQKEEPGSAPGLERFRQERYGDSRVTFYKKSPAPGPRP
ncbi:MAG: 16S rRNA (guanine(966)-N(2))-methyltransferase RsmD [Elusimicrobia bacterium GWA2_69_24]|nr:MAG: 16S rRNA (guanine(966)-N(2))-methyltransferase RsmD [Elusimicrobia bacterium GWA2_69_24]